MKPRHQRLALIGASLAACGVAVALVLNAFNDNLVFFYTPSQVAEGSAPRQSIFRIGGLVEEGSVKRLADGLTVSFVITDKVKQVPVHYKGTLPDLFKEGKGAVAQGRLGDGALFLAQEVLAKHDENYMPAEAAHALEQGRAPASLKGAP
ncbi:cytochrome c maturation protein CcmE [Pseudoduganella sp. DS3]|uniref:Cytochrome c-type biogenesis protein CcmE n=1 Tax=Pseudoduganella guangdongensis TaxID=2692179 RepID=A0A6N9HLC6_9BURK|nr:cytochrome c maturation protein CcmE [Pseudoduganella guangdongensis]MYN04471.1 cytochrome c maturation protein CcmE [Pseudoduganella guangdongensis]